MVIEGDPFSLIEAMTIAGYATDARARLRLPARRVPATRTASSARRIAEARRARLPRRRRDGGGLRVRHRDPQGRRRLHLRRGDGDLQLDRGRARRAAQQAAVPGRGRACSASRRWSTTSRRWSTCSTSLLAVRAGLRRAPAPRRSTGTKLFCLSGHVARPGVYEVPFGATLRELLELAGGVAGGRALQAVLLGGAAGGFVRPDELDLPLTFEGAREAKTTLGSGVVMVHGRHRRPAADADAHRRLLPQRVVRPVRALPRRHRAPAGGARAAAVGPARAAAWSAELGADRGDRASACATRRSAAWARRRRARSSRRSGGSASSEVPTA